VKSRIIYIVGGVLALAVVIGVSVLTSYLVGGRGATANAVNNAVPAHAEITSENTIMLNEFVTNLADQRQYVKVTMHLVLTRAKDKEQVEKAVPRIRDAVVQLLNTKKSMEVTGSAEANKQLKADVLKTLNDLLGANTVREVLITDIVVQF